MYTQPTQSKAAKKPSRGRDSTGSSSLDNAAVADLCRLISAPLLHPAIYVRIRGSRPPLISLRTFLHLISRRIKLCKMGRGALYTGDICTFGAIMKIIEVRATFFVRFLQLEKYHSFYSTVRPRLRDAPGAQARRRRIKLCLLWHGRNFHAKGRHVTLLFLRQNRSSPAVLGR